MRLLKLLSLCSFLLMTVLISGCDDGGANARAGDGGGMDEPGTEPAGCPCFTMDDVVGMSKNAVAVSCENTVWGLLFIFNAADPTEVFAQCASDGTNCQCYGPTTDNKTMDVSVGEASTCVHIMINSLIEFGKNGFEVLGCTFIPVGG